jgi:hypothetical protein
MILKVLLPHSPILYSELRRPASGYPDSELIFHFLHFPPNLIKIQRIFSHFRFFIYNLPLDHSTPGILDPFFAGIVHQNLLG